MTSMLRRRALLASFALAAGLIAAGAVRAEESITLHLPNAIGGPKPAPASWSVTCTSAARTAPPDCRADQRVFLQRTGQLLGALTISVPHDTRKPTLLVQAGFGIAIRSGISLQLDARPPVRLDVQTCDQGGCYAATVMSDDFLKAMLAAKKLTVIVIGLNGRPVTAPFSLQGFAGVYQQIR